MATITKSVQIRFEEETEQGRFCDALYFTEEQYAKLSDKDIQVAIDERVANWVAVVTAPPMEPEPVSDEELQAQETAKVDALLDQLAAVDTTLLGGNWSEIEPRWSEITDRITAEAQVEPEAALPSTGIDALDTVLRRKE